jgi:protease PrsW
MKVLRHGWVQIFVGGLILLCIVEWALFVTGNPNYIPSAIVLGAFLVPVTFVSYLYERLPNWDVPLRPVVICFVWGGILGTVVAGILEYDVARSLGFMPTLGIGLIEEAAKLIVPLVFYFIGRYRSEAAGIVLAPRLNGVLPVQRELTITLVAAEYCGYICSFVANLRKPSLSDTGILGQS